MPQKHLDRRLSSQDTIAFIAERSGAKVRKPLPRESRPFPSPIVTGSALVLLTLVTTLTLTYGVWSFSYGGSWGGRQLVLIPSPPSGGMDGPASRDWTPPSNGEMH